MDNIIILLNKIYEYLGIKNTSTANLIIIIYITAFLLRLLLPKIIYYLNYKIGSIRCEDKDGCGTKISKNTFIKSRKAATLYSVKCPKCRKIIERGNISFSTLDKYIVNKLLSFICLVIDLIFYFFILILLLLIYSIINKYISFITHRLMIAIIVVLVVTFLFRQKIIFKFYPFITQTDIRVFTLLFFIFWNIFNTPSNNILDKLWFPISILIITSLIVLSHNLREVNKIFQAIPILNHLQAIDYKTVLKINILLSLHELKTEAFNSAIQDTEAVLKYKLKEEDKIKMLFVHAESNFKEAMKVKYHNKEKALKLFKKAKVKFNELKELILNYKEEMIYTILNEHIIYRTTNLLSLQKDYSE